MPLTIRASVLSIVIAALTGCGGGSQPKESQPVKEVAPPPKIGLFYLSPSVIENGQTSQLCYSVEDTAKVSLDPPVDRVWPALTRCIEVKPIKNTIYTLTAENAAGVKVTSTAEAKVVASIPKVAGVKIVDISALPDAIRAGQGFQFCVHAHNAKDWKLSAGQWFNPPDSTGGCVIDHPTKTTTYKVTAIGAAGETDSMSVIATVK